MPEDIENYIGEEIMISHGDRAPQGIVRRRKRYVEVNTICRANSNPILHTWTYEVEFKDGGMSTYSQIFISEIMYAWCDEGRQKYLWFGSILYHKTDGHALSVADQDGVVCGQS